MNDNEIIKNIGDDYGLRGAMPFIYRKNKSWFILHLISDDDARQILSRLSAGWSVARYTSTTQIYSVI
jgi:hypothetical protein